MFLLYGKPWLIGGTVLLVTAILLSVFIDIRWLIIALMLVFIISPMILAFLFFYYGMNSVSTLNATHHNVEFHDNKIVVNIFMNDSPPSLPDKNDVPDEEGSGFNEEIKFEKRSQITIDCSYIKNYIVGTNAVILRTNVSGDGFLIIPMKVFDDTNRFIQAITTVTSGIITT